MAPSVTLESGAPGPITRRLRTPRPAGPADPSSGYAQRTTSTPRSLRGALTMDHLNDGCGGENHSTERRTGAHRASGETGSAGSPARIVFANNRRQRTETGAAAFILQR